MIDQKVQVNPDPQVPDPQVLDPDQEVTINPDPEVIMIKKKEDDANTE